jgi:hypothetical protein
VSSNQLRHFSETLSERKRKGERKKGKGEREGGNRGRGITKISQKNYS